jgi:hypothetical protein
MTGISNRIINFTNFYNQLKIMVVALSPLVKQGSEHYMGWSVKTVRYPAGCLTIQIKFPSDVICCDIIGESMHGLCTMPVAVTEDRLADKDRCCGIAHSTDYHRSSAICAGIWEFYFYFVFIIKHYFNIRTAFYYYYNMVSCRTLY